MEFSICSRRERKTAEIAASTIATGKQLGPIVPRMDPVTWAVENINFQFDVSAAFETFDIDLTPYLREPLMAWDFIGEQREVTIMAPEQMGKSLAWIIGLLWSMENEPCLSLVVYPSDDLGVKINQEKLEPLMKCISKLQAQLEMPHSKRKDSYKFSNLICYFQGAGSRITSHSARIRVCDEIDDWQDFEGRVAGIDDVRKRARSFQDSILYSVCTPTTNEGQICKLFLESSMGFFYGRCKKCNDLTLRTNDVKNLQWDLDKYGNVIPDSLRWVCPVCGRQHIESEKREMLLSGDYIHENPGLIQEKPGFSWGALASQFPALSWIAIARAQMKAGKSGDYKVKKLFWNSICGLPFEGSASGVGLIDKLKEHITTKVPVDDICAIFLSADTQDNCTYHICVALDVNSNVYVLDAKKMDLLDELKVELKEYRYNDILILAGIIDEGGHRTIDVNKMVAKVKNFFQYKGNNRVVQKISKSETKKKLFIVKEQEFKVELLYYLYTQENRENNYLFFTPFLPDEFYTQLADFKPNNKIKNGNRFENWESSGKDHYFDCLKMAYALIEWAKTHFPQKVFRKKGDWVQHKRSVRIKNRSNGTGSNWATRYSTRPI